MSNSRNDQHRTVEVITAHFKAWVKPDRFSSMWVLEWTDYVANTWTEKWPNREMAVLRLRELELVDIDEDYMLSDAPDFVDRYVEARGGGLTIDLAKFDRLMAVYGIGQTR